MVETTDQSGISRSEDLSSKEAILSNIVSGLSTTATYLQNLISQGVLASGFIELRQFVTAADLSTLTAFHRVTEKVFHNILVHNGIPSTYAKYLVESCRKADLHLPFRIRLQRNPLTVWGKVDVFLKDQILQVIRHALLSHVFPQENQRLAEVREQLRRKDVDDAIRLQIRSANAQVRRSIDHPAAVHHTELARVREFLEEHFSYLFSKYKEGVRLELDEAGRTWSLRINNEPHRSGTFDEVEDMTNPAFREARKSVRARWHGED